MDKKYIDIFSSDMDSLKNYINHLKLMQEIAKNPAINSSDFVEHFRQNSTKIKIFEYNSIVITLYGIVERNIEKFIKAYALIAMQENNAESASVRNRHIELSAKLIGVIMDGRQAKYTNLKIEDMVHSMHSILNKDFSTNISTDAFTIFSGNLDHKKIVELFKNVKIELSSALMCNRAFKNYIEKNYDGLIPQESEYIFSPLEDLLQRRNDVAHGGENIPLKNISDWDGDIEFIEQYIGAIFNILWVATTLPQIILDDCIPIDDCDVIDIFDDSILAFSIENQNICKNDVVVILGGDGKRRVSQILSIQKDGSDLDSYQAVEKTQIALGLSEKIKKNQKFFLFKPHPTNHPTTA